MSRIVAISPTPGDAVFSAGGTLHRHVRGGHEVVLVTVFAAGEGELAELRRDEDASAAARLGVAGPVRLAVGEPDDDSARVVRAVLSVALEQLEADLLLAPAAIGDRVEALTVDAVLRELGVPRLRWLDQPYSQRPGARVPDGDRVAVPLEEDDVTAKLEAVGHYASHLEELFGSPGVMKAQLGGDAEMFVRS